MGDKDLLNWLRTLVGTHLVPTSAKRTERCRMRDHSDNGGALCGGDPAPLPKIRLALNQFAMHLMHGRYAEAPLPQGKATC